MCGNEGLCADWGKGDIGCMKLSVSFIPAEQIIPILTLTTSGI